MPDASGTPAILHEPGIYFGMNEDEYHADPAFSNSGAGHILISPLDYWVNSRLNPDYVDEKTAAMIAGTAFHRRLLEPARYEKLYGVLPSFADFPDAIDGREALYAKCKEYGIKGMSSAKVAELCDALLDADPNLVLWPVIKAEAMKALADRIILPAETAADIERAVKFVQANADAAKCITGGHAEVSIFWIDEETGVRMKARIDYLKVKAIIDIKSFSNPLGKPIDAAVSGAVVFNRYHIQGVIYWEAVERAKQMLRKEKSACLHFMNGAEVSDEWLIQFAACARHSFFFLFIEQGPVTNVLVREFAEFDTFGGQGSSVNLAWYYGQMGYREALRRYVENMEKFGPDKPWVDDRPMRPFADTDFPQYMFQ
jgi:hypothetical protein